ncbi:MAG: aromatic-ring-hydroxylating dioxygenase subunit beta [Betaproteobacteria bacterium]
MATSPLTMGKVAPASMTGDLPRQAATRHEVEQLLYRQAAVLDAKQWQDYIDLFTDDGHYWMPASPGQTTGVGTPSIFYEDRNLMNVRMRRVLHPDAWSQRPLWGTNHVVGNVIVEGDDAATGEIVVRSRFHMMEFRRETSRHFAGSYVHHLVRTADGLRIRLQRVDMVNAQGPFDYVLQVWV